jgi:hypothetical protein
MNRRMRAMRICGYKQLDFQLLSIHPSMIFWLSVPIDLASMRPAVYQMGYKI